MLSYSLQTTSFATHTCFKIVTWFPGGSLNLIFNESFFTAVVVLKAERNDKIFLATVLKRFFEVNGYIYSADCAWYQTFKPKPVLYLAVNI